MKKQFDNMAKFFLCMSIVLFAISLTQKAFCIGNTSCDDTLPGWLDLLFGAIGVLLGGVYLSWLANPFIFLSWIFLKRIKYSLAFSLLAVITSGSFLLFSEIKNFETGDYDKITHYHTGYWIWLSSMVVMLTGNIIRLLNKKEAL
jgi:hypothetical protein